MKIISPSRRKRNRHRIIKLLERAIEQTEQSWEAAIEGAGREYAGGSAQAQRDMKILADNCESFYDSAREALEEGRKDRALIALEWARMAEADGGDDTIARDMIRAVATIGDIA